MKNDKFMRPWKNNFPSFKKSIISMILWKMTNSWDLEKIIFHPSRNRWFQWSYEKMINSWNLEKIIFYPSRNRWFQWSYEKWQIHETLKIISILQEINNFISFKKSIISMVLWKMTNLCRPWKNNLSFFNGPMKNDKFM
jgi:hypothetical protein